MKDADASIGIYSKLEQDIYAKIINTLKTTKFDTVDSTNVLRWQVEQLAKMGVLNRQVIAMVAEFTGKSKQSIEKLVQDNGYQIVNEVDATLSDQLHKKVTVDDDIRSTINSLNNQTWKDLDNTVNQTLLSTNYGENGAMRAYQSIIKQTTMETAVGLKTHERALRDTVYKMVDAGIKSNLVDKGGHNWSLEGYSRTVIQTTAHRTFNNLRLKRMRDYGTTLAVMSAHPAAREACAPIQGHVINLTEPGSDTFNPKYDSLFNHGYGTPAGTQGINCSHTLYPFIEGVNTNNQPQYDSNEAMANGDVQAKQRGRERAIRQTKKKLAAAQELGDDEGVARYKSLLSNQQKSVRELVRQHDFLHRDYSREQVYSKSDVEQVKNVGLTEDQKYTQTKIVNGEWGTEINAEKQAPHMESTHLEGKSYLYDSEDPQKLLNQYSGTGKLERDRTGKYTNKEKVHVDHIVGYDGRTNSETDWIKIHHSKKRTHIVPLVPQERTDKHDN